MSDGNVTSEKGRSVAHSFNCTPTFAYTRLADALAHSLVAPPF